MISCFQEIHTIDVEMGEKGKSFDGTSRGQPQPCTIPRSQQETQSSTIGVDRTEDLRRYKALRCFTFCVEKGCEKQ